MLRGGHENMTIRETAPILQVTDPGHGESDPVDLVDAFQQGGYVDPVWDDVRGVTSCEKTGER